MQATSGQAQAHQGSRTGVDAIGSFPIMLRQDNTAPPGFGMDGRARHNIYRRFGLGGGRADRTWLRKRLNPHLLLPATLMAIEMPIISLFSQPFGRFTDCNK